MKRRKEDDNYSAEKRASGLKSSFFFAIKRKSEAPSLIFIMYLKVAASAIFVLFSAKKQVSKNGGDNLEQPSRFFWF